MKVFLTVGSMLRFDRLVSAMDQWAVAHSEAEVFAQIGDTDLKPRALRAVSMLTPPDYRRACADADLIVSHVGMGTVITAAEFRKPMVALPRRKELGEVTSDHQVATARWLRGRAGIVVVEDASALPLAITAAVATLARMEDFGQRNRARLIASVRDFLQVHLRD